MSQSALNIRIDSELKREFDEFCSQVGMSASTAINIFVRKVLQERRIPFEIGIPEDPFYSESNLRRLRESIGQYRSGSARPHDMIEAE